MDTDGIDTFSTVGISSVSLASPGSDITRALVGPSNDVTSRSSISRQIGRVSTVVGSLPIPIFLVKAITLLSYGVDQAK